MKKLFTLFTLVVMVACNPYEPYQPTTPTGGNNGNNTNNGNNNTTIKNATADFSYEPITPYAEQKVTFTNKSSYGYYYEWDFGNGKSSKEKNPTTTFTQGTWTVTLTAWNQDKSQKDRLQKTINVKAKPTKVKLTHFIINSVDYEDSDGRYWDDSSKDAPDVYFMLYDSNNKQILNSNYIENATENKLPYTFTISNTYLTLSETYKFIIKDYDAIIDDTMLSFSFKPAEYLTEYQESITLNFKEGSNGKFSFTLKFQYE